MTGMYVKDDYIGIHSLLSNEPFSDTATALEETVLCLIPKDQLDELLNLHPEIAREFIKLLSNDIREKEEQLLQLAYHSVRKRMAETIVRLSKRQPELKDNIKISREDLAAMAGMATETVSRTLSDFKDEGLIEKKGSNILILNLDKLAKMKN
jgi:CRP-like cAMP-binding protein